MQRDQMVWNKRALAFASGLLIGGFLFRQFGYGKNGELYGWEWYLAAVLLAGIGLARMFPEARLSSAIGLGISPTLIESVELYRHPAESMWPIVLPMIFVFTFPVPLIASGMSALLTRTRLPRAVYFIALASALVIGALLPQIQNVLQQRLATRTVPGILKQVYDAEMTYRARQPDGKFACDGTLLPGAAGRFGWGPGNDPTIKNNLIVQYYSIGLDCLNEANPRSFRLRAASNDGHIPGPRLSIDEHGKLLTEPVPPNSP
jgi:hypothetical protein